MDLADYGGGGDYRSFTVYVHLVPVVPDVYSAPTLKVPLLYNN